MAFRQYRVRLNSLRNCRTTDPRAPDESTSERHPSHRLRESEKRSAPNVVVCLEHLEPTRNLLDLDDL